MLKITLLIGTLFSLNIGLINLPLKENQLEGFSYHRQVEISDASFIKASTFDQDIIPPYDYLEEEYSYLNEPFYTGENNYLSYLDEINLGDILNQYRGENVKVAVLDTGYNYLHEEFSYLDENNKRQSLFSPDSALINLDYNSSTGEYYLDIYPVKDYGYEVIMEDTNPETYSANNHGTAVAGTIFSQINGVGGFGVAPNVELIAIKLGHLYLDEIKYALEYLLEIGDVDIVTMSLGVYAESFTTTIDGQTYQISGTSEVQTYLADVIKRCYQNDIFVLASAGNENTTHISYPAGNDYVYSVGALDDNDLTKRASYSNYGNVDIYAPGTVVSPTGFYDDPKLDPNSSYGIISGTSFSCPLVAGIAALYKAKYPYAKPNQIAEAINLTATDLGESGHDDIFGYGRISISDLMSFVPLKQVTSHKNLLLAINSEPLALDLELSPSNASNQDFIIINQGAENVLDYTNNIINPLNLGDFAYEYHYLNHAPLKGTENDPSDFIIKVSGQVLNNFDDVILSSFNETFFFNQELNINDFFLIYQDDYYDIPIANNIYFNYERANFIPRKEIILSYLGHEFPYFLNVSIDDLSTDDFPLAVNAYLNYFDEITHQECLNNYDHFSETLWNDLKILYEELISKNPQYNNEVVEAMNDDLLERYRLITNKYQYDDFLDLNLETFLFNHPLVDETNNNLLIIITTLSVGFFILLTFLTINRHKGQQKND